MSFAEFLAIHFTKEKVKKLAESQEKLQSGLNSSKDTIEKLVKLTDNFELLKMPFQEIAMNISSETLNSFVRLGESLRKLGQTEAAKSFINLLIILIETIVKASTVLVQNMETAQNYQIPFENPSEFTGTIIRPGESNLPVVRPGESSIYFGDNL